MYSSSHRSNRGEDGQQWMNIFSRLNKLTSTVPDPVDSAAKEEQDVDRLRERLKSMEEELTMSAGKLSTVTFPFSSI
jgi:hypothetical protein